MASRSLGTLTVDLLAKTGAFTAGLSKAQRDAASFQRGVTNSMQSLQSSVDSAGSAIRRTLGGLFAGFSAAAFVRSLTDANIEMQRIQYTLQQSFGTGAAQQFQFVSKTAERLGIDLKSAAQGYAALAASAQGTGVQTKDLQRFFVGMSDAATVLHTSTADVNGVLIQLSQGLSLGKLQMQDIRAIAQHLPGTMTVLQEAARRLGTTLEDALAHGGLDAAKAIGVIGDVMQERFGGQAVEASRSLNSELARLHNTIFSMQTDGSQFGDAMADALRQLNETLKTDDVQKAFAAIVEGAGNAAVAIAKLSTHLTEIAVFFGARFVAVRGVAIFASIVAGAGEAAIAVRALTAAMGLMGGPIGIAATLFAAAAVAAYEFSTSQTDAQKATDALRESSRLLRTSYDDLAPAQQKTVDNSLRVANAALTEAKAQLAVLEANRQRIEKSRRDMVPANANIDPSKIGGSIQFAIDARKKGIDELAGSIADLEQRIMHPLTPPKLAEIIGGGRVSSGGPGKVKTPKPDPALETLNSLLSKSAGTTADYQKKLTQLFSLYKSGRVGVDDYRSAVEQLIAEQPFARDAAKQMADGQKLVNELLNTSAGVTADYQENVAALARELAAGRVNIDQYREAMAALIKQQPYSQNVQKMQDEISKAAQKSADEARQKWQRTSDEISQSMADALMNGGQSAGEFIKNYFKTLVLQPLLKPVSDQFAQALQPISSGISGMLAGLFGGAAQQVAFSGVMPAAGASRQGILAAFNANGNVFDSPDLHRYVNQVHDTPHYFKFAAGGVFGEAGPEAIMPLARGADGKLGVKSAGGSTGNVTVNVINQGGQQLAVQQTQQRTGPNGEQMIDVIVRQSLQRMAGNGQMDSAMRPYGGRRATVF